MTSRLREEAQKLHLLGLGELAPDLEALAVACEERGPTPIHYPDSYAVSRRPSGARLYPSNDGYLSPFVLKGLCGTVATTAGVVFSKEITEDRVRDMARAYRSRMAIA